jgi:hypothetical protein
MGVSGCSRLNRNRKPEPSNADHIGINSLNYIVINADLGERAARLISRLVLQV